MKSFFAFLLCFSLLFLSGCFQKNQELPQENLNSQTQSWNENTSSGDILNTPTEVIPLESSSSGNISPSENVSQNTKTSSGEQLSKEQQEIIQQGNSEIANAIADDAFGELIKDLWF